MSSIWTQISFLKLKLIFFLLKKIHFNSNLDFIKKKKKNLILLWWFRVSRKILPTKYNLALLSLSFLYHYLILSLFFFFLLSGSLTPNSFSPLFYGCQGEDKFLKMLEVSSNMTGVLSILLFKGLLLFGPFFFFRFQNIPTAYV